jgi:hypothetical protein
MNATRRKTLTAIAIPDLLEALEGHRERIEAAKQALVEDPSHARVAALTALLEAAANESGEADNLHEQVQAVADEEQEAFDNLSEGLQQSAMGQRIGEAVDFLTAASDSLTEVEGHLNDALEACGSIAQVLSGVIEDTEGRLWFDYETRSELDAIEALAEVTVDGLTNAIDAAQYALDEIEQAIGC